jgi:hypothetical protein
MNGEMPDRGTFDRAVRSEPLARRAGCPVLWVLNGDSGVNEERPAGGGAGSRVEMDPEDVE